MVENSKKKKIIHSILFTLLGVVIGVIAVIIAINIINLQESPEIDDVNLEEEYPEAWAELGESLKYLELGEKDFYCGDNATYVFTDKFKEVFHKMHGGYYKNTSDEQIHAILLDKIDRMTTFELNAGEVYEKLKPIDGATIEAYLEIINKRIAENKATEETELAESKTASAQRGFSIGDKVNFNFSDNKKELTYQGGDKWVDSDGIIYIASKTDDGLNVGRETPQVTDNTQNNNSSSSNKNNNQSSNKNNNSNNTPPSDSDNSGDDGQTRGTSNLPDGWTDESDDFDPDNVIHDPDDGSWGWKP